MIVERVATANQCPREPVWAVANGGLYFQVPEMQQGDNYCVLNIEDLKGELLKINRIPPAVDLRDKFLAIQVKDNPSEWKSITGDGDLDPNFKGSFPLVPCGRPSSGACVDLGSSGLIPIKDFKNSVIRSLRWQNDTAKEGLEWLGVIIAGTAAGGWLLYKTLMRIISTAEKAREKFAEKYNKKVDKL